MSAERLQSISYNSMFTTTSLMFKVANLKARYGKILNDTVSIILSTPLTLVKYFSEVHNNQTVVSLKHFAQKTS